MPAAYQDILQCYPYNVALTSDPDTLTQARVR